VNTDLSFFNLIIPCGITAKPVTSMQQELGKALDLNAVAESISRNFGTVFSRVRCSGSTRFDAVYR
jgi:lipoyl(octanoyl) transferase